MSSDKPKRVRDRTVGSLVTPARVAIAVVVLLAVIFIIQNTRYVTIRLIIPEITIPLWLALALTFLVGAICGLYWRRDGRR